MTSFAFQPRRTCCKLQLVRVSGSISRLCASPVCKRVTLGINFMSTSANVPHFSSNFELHLIIAKLPSFKFKVSPLPLKKGIEWRSSEI